jgi:hypothetical protein
MTKALIEPAPVSALASKTITWASLHPRFRTPSGQDTCELVNAETKEFIQRHEDITQQAPRSFQGSSRQSLFRQ